MNRLLTHTATVPSCYVLPDWLDSDRLQQASTAIPLVLLGVGLLLILRLVKAVVMKVIWSALIIVLALLIWSQRTVLEECRQTCSCRVLGQDIEVSGSSICGPEGLRLPIGG
jgi:hypothetical protein